MRTCLASALLSLTGLLYAQNIFTVAGIPYTHRNAVDSQPALSAPLNSVYGLLIDKITGRLLFNDEVLVLRLEPDGTLLALAGRGPNREQQFRRVTTGSTLASILSVDLFRGMAQDATGLLYLSDVGAGRVYRVASDGTVTTFAGGGTQPPGFQSDGGLAIAAQLASPRGLVFDSKGNLDIAEVFCNCIRQVTPGGIISTLYTLPSLSPFNRIVNVEGLAIDAQDNLYFTEWLGNLVVKVAADGSAATTIAGTGVAGFSGDGGPAAAANLNGPSGVTLDENGNIYIADTRNHRIRKVAPDGTITTIAGTGTCGFSGDGGPAAIAQLCYPAETLFDSSGSLLIADYGNRRVRKMATDGTITTIAGSGKNDANLFFPGSSGNGGPEIHAAFNLVGGIAIDPAGNLYVSEAQGNVIRKIAPDGTVGTFAGTGQRGTSGDGGPAIRADLFNPGPLSVGPDGAVYVITSDSRVRKIAPDGRISLVAGTGTGTGLIRSQGDGGLAVNATLNEPGEVAFDRQGNIYIADTSNARVRKIDKGGIITTVAGPGQQGVDYYNAVAVDPQGNLYVAWTHALPPSVYATVNRVNPDGSLTPVAGTGQPCTGGPGQFAGDGVPATQARLCAVVGLAVDPNGLLTLSEGGYSLVLRLAADGTLQRVAGNTAATNIGDGGPALEASLIGGQGWSPGTVAFDPAGNLYIAEPGLNYIRQVIRTAHKAEVLPDRISVSGATTQSQALTVSGNFAEPFPYAVRVSTADGGSWLSANRVTGLTGESIQVSVNPAGLSSGSYHGTVAVTVSLPDGGISQEVDIPVSLMLPAQPSNLHIDSAK
jgi:sugar lactone lactonase YvrE